MDPISSERADSENPNADGDEPVLARRSSFDLARTATTDGWAMLATGVVAFIAGLLANFREFAAVGVALIVAVVLAATWIALVPDLRVRRTLTTNRVVEGDPAEANLIVKNVSSRRSLPVTAIDAVGRFRPELQIPSLAAGDTERYLYRLPTKSRARLDVGPLQVTHEDPLRLMRFGRSAGTAETLFVHPRHYPVDPLPTQRSRDLEGVTSLRSSHGGVDFHALRRYVEGDDLRQVHWPSTARVRQLVVRVNVVTNEPRFQILLDLAAASYEGGSFDDATRIAASWIHSGIGTGHEVQLVMDGEPIRVSADGLGLGEAMDALAAAELTDDPAGLHTLVVMEGRRVPVALGVVTGDPTPERVGDLAALAGQFESVSVAQVAPVFRQPPMSIGSARTVQCSSSEEFAAAWAFEVR